MPGLFDPEHPGDTASISHCFEYTSTPPWSRAPPGGTTDSPGIALAAELRNAKVQRGSPPSTHRWPNGSRTRPCRRPYGRFSTGITSSPPCRTICAAVASGSGTVSMISTGEPPIESGSHHPHSGTLWARATVAAAPPGRRTRASPPGHGASPRASAVGTGAPRGPGSTPAPLRHRRGPCPASGRRRRVRRRDRYRPAARGGGRAGRALGHRPAGRPIPRTACPPTAAPRRPRDRPRPRRSAARRCRRAAGANSA